MREDNTRVVLTAGKGVYLVVMDREEYIKKAEELLNQAAFKVIPADPTTKQKNKLILLLKNIKVECEINEEIYRGCTPQVLAPLNSMSYQRSIKQEFD